MNTRSTMSEKLKSSFGSSQTSIRYILPQLYTLGLSDKLLQCLATNNSEQFLDITGIPPVQSWDGICTVEASGHINALIALVYTRFTPISRFDSNTILDHKQADAVFIEILNNLFDSSHQFWTTCRNALKEKQSISTQLYQTHSLNEIEFREICQTNHTAIYITLNAIFSLALEKNEAACDTLKKMINHVMCGIQMLIECRSNPMPFMTRWSLPMRRRFPLLDKSLTPNQFISTVKTINEHARSELEIALEISLELPNPQFQNLIIQTLKNWP